MKLLEQASAAEAAVTALLAGGNGWHFARQMRRRDRRARRVAAASLVLLNAAFAGEALLYAWVMPEAGRLGDVATFSVRTLSLAAVAVLSALVLRARAWGRR
jgi:hypothetical protein